MENNIYKTKVYVYGILNDNDEVIYVGKSSAPRVRLSDHKRTKGWNRMKILDYFYDTEMYWIEKLRRERKLENKFDRPNEEDWEVGDMVVVDNKRVVSVLDKETGKEYKSIADASRELNLTRGKILYSLRESKNKRFELL